MHHVGTARWIGGLRFESRALDNAATKENKKPAQSADFGGERWIRTIEVVGRQIYSLVPLAARESPHMLNMCRLELVNGIEPSTY